MERFVADFLRLLDQRLAAVIEALAESDPEGATTVLRSLETTGAMLGANDLAAAAATLRRAVHDDPDRVDQRLREFFARAEELRVRLTALSSTLSVPPGPIQGPGQSGSANR